jgi:hypothetical protein
MYFAFLVFRGRMRKQASQPLCNFAPNGRNCFPTFSNFRDAVGKR